MPRRKESFLEFLMVVPWYVSVIVAASVYLLLAVVLPTLDLSHSPVFRGFQVALPELAPVLALVLLAPAPISVFIAWSKRRRLDTQKSIDTIRNLSWKEFEELVAEAYRRQGYAVIENHRGGPDGGVDIRLKKAGELHLIQCKHWKKQNVGVPIVRELYGVMAAKHASAGSVVCSGTYSQAAKDFAHGKNIDLVDGRQLETMIKNVQSVQLTHAGQESESRTSTTGSEPCPRCGNELVIRTARKGKNPGNEFLGCSAFPACRHSQDI